MEVASGGRGDSKRRRTSKSSGRSTDDGDGPGRLLASVKRQTVATACDSCRSKKVKCDGERPCGYCHRRELICSFETDVPAETPQQARKRKAEEDARLTEDFKQLFQVLAGNDAARANDIYRRIRRGEDVQSLITYIQVGGASYVQPSTLDERLRRIFLFSLIESTATLHQVEDIAYEFMSNNQIKPPSADKYDMLRDRIVTEAALRDMLAAANDEIPQPVRAIGDTNKPPLFWVIAKPWLPSTSDYEASHLLSLFLCYLNHSWRFVEPVPFLNDMRSGNMSSQYCSPFLLNAMMALASMNSDLSDESYEHEPHQEKGLKYHEEALRLWSAADAEPSVTNIQGLTILALECLIRGKDKLGFHLLNAASLLNRELAIPVRSDGMGPKETEYFIIRGCVWWMTVHFDLTYKIGLMTGKDDTDWDAAPDLHGIMSDNLTYWVGYPFRDDPVPIRPNMVFEYQCHFTLLLQDAIKLLLYDAKKLGGRLEHYNILVDLVGRFEAWHNGLPVELHLDEKMPPSLYDLHVQYHCILMVLHERTCSQMFSSRGRSATRFEGLALEQSAEAHDFLRGKALHHCYEGATLIRAFRETYGLKCVSIIMLNHSVTGAFICMNDIHSNQGLRFDEQSDQTGHVNDTISALEEFFRIQLATSLRSPLSHGLALVAYNTAIIELKIQLPERIMRMVEIMGDIAWRTSDLTRLATTYYPNWSMTHSKQTARVEDYRMGHMLQEWESPASEDGPVEAGPSNSGGGAYDPVRDQ